MTGDVQLTRAAFVKKLFLRKAHFNLKNISKYKIIKSVQNFFYVIIFISFFQYGIGRILKNGKKKDGP